MGGYILRRLLLMIPTLIGIMAISFIVMQFAPGGPVEQVIAELTGQGNNTTERISGGNDLQGAAFNDDFNSQYRGAHPPSARHTCVFAVSRGALIGASTSAATSGTRAARRSGTRARMSSR